MLGFVIGDSDMLTGFRLVGVEGTEVVSAEEAHMALNKALLRNDVALILISEDFSVSLRSEIDDIRSKQIAPVIVEIPGRRGSSGAIRMSDLVTKTLGIKI